MLTRNLWNMLNVYWYTQHRKPETITVNFNTLWANIILDGSYLFISFALKDILTVLQPDNTK